MDKCECIVAQHGLLPYPTVYKEILIGGRSGHKTEEKSISVENKGKNSEDGISRWNLMEQEGSTGVDC